MARLHLLFVVLCAALLASDAASFSGFNDENRELEEDRSLEMYPLKDLKARRDLDFCQTNPNPCSHGGTCCSSPACTHSSKYTCRCKSPYSGPHCDKKCPIKECWDEYYKKAYNNGRKRDISDSACRSHVEGLSECVKSAEQTEEACHCEVGLLEEAHNFNKARKEEVIARQCGGSQQCEDPRIHECVTKIYKLGGAMDSNKDRTETEKCSMVDEAVSCMNALAGSDFAGCASNRKLFTVRVGMRQAQWRTWCLGKYCSLNGCGHITVPSDCRESSMVASIKPVVNCMKERLEKCVPSKIKQLQSEIREIETEARDTIISKCKVRKQVSGKCEGHKRVLQARELLRALLEETMEK